MGRRRKFRLRGKRVLVTGAAGGIGSALAERLQARGARLLLHDRNRQLLDELAERLRTGDEQSAVEGCAGDLTRESDRAALVQRAAAGGLDVLVNNAGIVLAGSFATMDAEAISAHVAINLLAPLRLTRMLLPLLRERGRAHIVNVASGAGLAAPAGLAAYAASKFGLVGFSEALRAELHEQGIGVSVVCPAFVKTDIVSNSCRELGREPGQVESLNTLVHRLGVAPERVAAKIIRAIERNRARVVIGLWPKLLLAARASSPGLAGWVNRRVYRRLRRRGLLA